jgi:hypothetical protein
VHSRGLSPAWRGFQGLKKRIPYWSPNTKRSHTPETQSKLFDENIIACGAHPNLRPTLPPPTDAEKDTLMSMLSEFTGTAPEVVSDDEIEDLYYECHRAYRPIRPSDLTYDELLVVMSEATDCPLGEVSSETLKKGLQKLGIKATRGRNRSG